MNETEFSHSEENSNEKDILDQISELLSELEQLGGSESTGLDREMTESEIAALKPLAEETAELVHQMMEAFFARPLPPDPMNSSISLDDMRKMMTEERALTAKVKDLTEKSKNLEGMLATTTFSEKREYYKMVALGVQNIIEEQRRLDSVYRSKS